MTSATGVAEVGSERTIAGTDSTELATVVTAFVIGPTTFDNGVTGDTGATGDTGDTGDTEDTDDRGATGSVAGAASFEFESTELGTVGVGTAVVSGAFVPAAVVGLFAVTGCWTGLASELSVWVTPRTA